MRSCLSKIANFYYRSCVILKVHKGSVVRSIVLSSAMQSDKKPGVLRAGEDPSKLTDADWKSRLPEERYEVLRQHGTERPFTGEYTYNKESGFYHCGCCGVQLFSSSSKFDSGCGWPSFYEALGREDQNESNTNVIRKEDNSFGMNRVEVLCKQCSAHLGHVFPDGPNPTGERFCINSVSLDFMPSKKK